MIRAVLFDMDGTVFDTERIYYRAWVPAARELGLRAEECMVVEDSHNGVLAGFHASMPVVMVPDLQPVTQEITPYVTHLLGSLRELSALIPSAEE